MDIAGYMGAVTYERPANEACVINSVIWATQCWDEADAPGVGDSLLLADSNTWYVRKVQRLGCFLVLELCRAAIPCPDCLVSVYSMERMEGADCEDPLESVSIATEIPATICPVELDVEVWGDAEVSRHTVLICLEGATDIEPQMVISCGSDNYRVTKIRRKCSGMCLTTVEAELDNLGLLET